MKMLVVDDNEFVVKGLQSVMQFLGHDSDVARGYSAAYEMALSTKYDVIITDHQMPDGTGLNLIETLMILEELKQTRYILMSALPQLGIEIRPDLNNYLGFLQKPFTIAELKALISQI